MRTGSATIIYIIPSAYHLVQRFSTCGPRTLGGPRGASKGSMGKSRKVVFFFLYKVLLSLVDWLALS